MLTTILYDLAGLLIFAGAVYGAVYLVRRQTSRPSASGTPPVTTGGATGGSDDDGPPAPRRPKAM